MRIRWRHESHGLQGEGDVADGQLHLAQPSHRKDKKGEGKHIDGELKRCRNAFAQDLGEQRPVDPAPGQYPVKSVVDLVEDQCAIKEGDQRPGAYRGDPRPADSHFRKDPDAVDQCIIQGNVEKHADDIDDHHRPCLPPSREKTGQRDARHVYSSAQAKDPEIAALQLLDLRWMTAQPENRLRQKRQAGEQQGRRQ